MAKAKAQGKMIANNKKAYHDYFILDTYEAGIALAGTEVKSSAWENAASKNPLSVLRMGKCSSMECISVHTKREIFSIKILCV